MSLKKDYKVGGKMRCGPGGFKCRCCNPYGVSPRNAKPLLRRWLRRTTKIQSEE